MEKEVQKMIETARRLGYVCLKVKNVKAELGTAIGSRIMKRVGQNIHQMVTLSLPYFPLDLLKELIPLESMVKEGNETAWTLSTIDSLDKVMGPILSESRYCFTGSTKAFQTKSQPAIRLLGKLIPDMEFAHVCSAGGQEKLFVNGMYILVTEHGEIHWPKDEAGRELLFSAEVEAELRRAVLKDVRAMGQAGRKLAAGFWRQLGEEAKATAVEEEMRRWREARAPKQGRQKRSRPRKATSSREEFEIERIVGEKQVGKMLFYLVRWIGYDAAWEIYRSSGQVGEPIETWEPLSLVRDTLALQEWRAASANTDPHHPSN